ncbi:MAG: diguanylate cyclase/phosphodiesterase [Frankiales bacterium]|nr:diguanylate cyclase/phosphodiesterase [Frankiales bacterium]
MGSRASRRARARKRGAPLWAYLTALVLVPLLGVAVLTLAAVRSSVAEAESAARAEAAVRAVAQLDAARSGVEHEVVPALALVILADPVITARVGLPSAVMSAAAKQYRSAVQTTRRTTDTALAQVPAGAVGAAAARRALGELAVLRSRADANTVSLNELYYAYVGISDELTAAQSHTAAAANSEDVPVPTLAAMRDVQLVAQLAQAVTRQMPLFVDAEIQRGTPQPADEPWRAAWQAYADAQRQMSELTSPSLRGAWAQLRSASAVTALDAVLATRVADAGATALPATRLVAIVNQAAERDRLVTHLLDTAVDDAQNLAAADRVRANDRRTSTLVLGLGILLVSLLGALVLGRRVSRALGLLAGQADQVSKGSLVEVEVLGPREVRTVSLALGSAVGSLRRIQAQAHAVARGDLADPVLAEPLAGPLGEVVHASVEQMVSAVRQREELQSALAHQAAHDPLTDLPNRSQAVELVTSALHRGARSGDMAGLLFIDLDGFKAVNDAYGHACGDDVLRQAAHRMRSAVRPGDVVCRLGGDEFIVLVEAVGNERDLVDLAGRLIAAVSEPIPAEGGNVVIGASIGVAVSRDAGTDPDVLLAEADIAAYRAKQRGRGRAEMFDENLRAQLSERAELEAAVAHGLAAGEMQLHYQPVLDVATDRLIGYEALVRWNRPGHGMVPPDSFIPVAEESRLICDLDRWVLGEATRQLAEWRAGWPATEPEPTVAVNISGRHLADRRVVHDVADALAASGVPARLLILEVTETVLVDDPAAITHLAALRDLGVSIAIDDFGTGYTSIGQLRTMPVDTLKIDRSFIASTEHGNPELVALIIRAAHTFGLTVVAEGVEEQAQLDQLRADACDQAQGYLLYRPMPAEDAGALLRPQRAVPGPA